MAKEVPQPETDQKSDLLDHLSRASKSANELYDRQTALKKELYKISDEIKELHNGIIKFWRQAGHNQQVRKEPSKDE